MKPLFALAFCIAAFAGCQPNEAILKSSRNGAKTDPAATIAPRKTSFEQDLADMRDAGFDYIFALRRKDGKAFDDEDRKFLRESIPPEVNRRVSSDDGKAFIFGSGFAIDVKNVRLWETRFVVEEHSKPTEAVESKR